MREVMKPRRSGRGMRLWTTVFLCVSTAASVSTLSENVRAEDDEEEEEKSAKPKGERAASAEILVNPIGLIFGLFNAEVGVGLTDNLSVNMNGSYWSLGVNDVDVTAYGGGAGVQWFFTGQLYDGWFIYPSLQFARARATSGEQSAQATAFGMTALAGYQWDWKPFTLRLGGGFTYFSGTATGDDIETGFNGASPALDASLGFTF